MRKQTIFFSIFWLVLGIILMACHIAGWVESFWGSMGTGILFVGIVQSARCLHYFKNAEYREKYDTDCKDERNRFLSGKAWAWSGYLFVLTAGVATIVFKLLGYDEWTILSAGAICLMLLYYCISYFFLRKKY